ncbi:L-threonylcarbamoyladenylate synthase [Alphaproteobacteria bacterium endosymbiont of Tiliacea citrago]|uniref:L-threonylcarbamoyladenylate synthase n=1 Tax=Alphaproteobacteria bacterium endosymbiont of Tiliacea citrago TaxID=3077944 RepID=UPI00313DD1DF
MLTIDEAVNSLKKSNVLILPTDTLYGIGALAYSYFAVKKVFDLKKRNYNKAMPVHYANIALIEKDCVIEDQARILMERHWPGGLTIILKKKTNSKLQFVNDSVAVRIPNNKDLLKILEIIDQPLVMPSANISDEENIFYFKDIQKKFNLDGIESDLTIKQAPSTIISFDGGAMKILRQGVVKL